MIRSHANVREVTRHVAELPPDYEVRRRGEDWVVAGPTGIVAVGRVDGDPARDAARVSMLAHDVRAGLSELMPWVPFVDALLVAHPDQLAGVPPAALPCAVVEPAVLPVALTSGPRTIEGTELEAVHRHLGLVVVGLGRDDGTNDGRTLNPA